MKNIRKIIREEIDSDWDWAKKVLDEPIVRIKTEDEFIEEHGEDWRTDDGGPIDWPYEMDYLFDKTFKISDIKMDILGRFDVLSEDNTGPGGWSIHKNMYERIN